MAWPPAAFGPCTVCAGLLLYVRSSVPIPLLYVRLFGLRYVSAWVGVGRLQSQSFFAIALNDVRFWG